MSDSHLIGKCVYCGQDYCMNCSDADKFADYCDKDCENEDTK